MHRLREHLLGEAAMRAQLLEAHRAMCVGLLAGKVKQRFAPQHCGRLQMLLTDPDGRVLGIEAPLRKKKPRARRQ